MMRLSIRYFRAMPIALVAGLAAAAQALTPDNRIERRLHNFGHGAGEVWARNKAHCENAWPAVLGSLEKRFAAKG
jgi:hypothetical protein